MVVVVENFENGTPGADIEITAQMAFVQTGTSVYVTSPVHSGALAAGSALPGPSGQMTAYPPPDITGGYATLFEAWEAVYQSVFPDYEYFRDAVVAAYGSEEAALAIINESGGGTATYQPLLRWWHYMWVEPFGEDMLSAEASRSVMSDDSSHEVTLERVPGGFTITLDGGPSAAFPASQWVRVEWARTETGVTLTIPDILSYTWTLDPGVFIRESTIFVREPNFWGMSVYQDDWTWEYGESTRGWQIGSVAM